jgi:hypothetical protein
VNPVLTASTQINNKGSGSNLQIQPLSNSARKLARTKALEEADAVLAAQTFRTNRRLENFNILGVVTNPRILDDISPHLLIRRGDVISDTFIASLSTW